MFGTVASLDYKEQTTTALTCSEQNAVWENTSTLLQKSKTAGEVTVTTMAVIYLWYVQQVTFRDKTMTSSWGSNLTTTSGVLRVCLVLTNFKKRQPEMSYCRTHSSPTLLMLWLLWLIIMFHSITYNIFSLLSKATCELTGVWSLPWCIFSNKICYLPG